MIDLSVYFVNNLMNCLVYKIPVLFDLCGSLFCPSKGTKPPNN